MRQWRVGDVLSMLACVVTLAYLAWQMLRAGWL